MAEIETKAGKMSRQALPRGDRDLWHALPASRPGAAPLVVFGRRSLAGTGIRSRSLADSRSLAGAGIRSRGLVLPGLAGLSLLELRTHLSHKGRHMLVDLAVLVSFIWPHKEKI
jgi:hypothetical protein